MEPFIQHRGRIMPLRRSTVDTDQIIPAAYLKRVSRHGFADGLFAAWREDPEFVLNDQRYSGASILVAGPDFGTGSSREHAVWALSDWGFRVVVSPRFGDIFRQNALKGGLLPVEVELAYVERLWAAAEADPGTSVTVDLRDRRIRLGDAEQSFALDDFSRWRLMSGLDDIGLTLRWEAAIGDYEQRRPPFLPVVA
jgi:3-isopropylmalate/(R)-2-methylmalate dehydratase small subunit